MRLPRIRKGFSTTRTWVGTDAKVVRHVRVCGQGELAAATRLELERLGIHRKTDDLLCSLRPALVIACADHEADQSSHEVAQWAANEGSPLLFCCLTGRTIRLGPLIDTLGCFMPPDPMEPQPSSLPYPLPPQDSNLRPAARNCTAEASLQSSFHARLGALLISAQALNFLLGARNQCVRNRVVELNPWLMESKSYRVFPS